MHESDIKRYLQSGQYAKRKLKYLGELNTALGNLKSTDVTVRLIGAKRLSYHSRRELGVDLLCVREWFSSELIRTELSKICATEADDKVLQHSLIALYFIYERYIIHEMWLKDYFFTLEEIKRDEFNYIQWVLPIAEACYRFSAAIFVKEVLARIFAICRDSRAWDIYIEILPKKSAYCGWGRKICSQYARYSITESQKDDLVQALDKIIAKVKNLHGSTDASEMQKVLNAL